MQMPEQLPFLATMGPPYIVMLDTGVFESLLRETDLKRSMMCNHTAFPSISGGSVCPFGPRSLEEQGRLGCREQRVWGAKV